MQWYIREFGITETDCNMIISSMGFDLTQKNIFGTLLAGGSIALPEMQYYDSQEIVKCILANQVTLLNCAPNAFYPLTEEPVFCQRPNSLRVVILGGEPIHLERLSGWLYSSGHACELVNSYGPTECTDIAAFHRMKEPLHYLNRTIPIGRPNDNVRLYVLDGSGYPQPVGALGEICIGGVGVGAGYINDETLTRLKFRNNPFDGGRLYHTGDLGRWLPDGNMEYWGRMDNQVKIRGYRIELGEIEVVLGQSDRVKEAAVLVREDSQGDKQLIAYVVPQEDFNREAVMGHIRSKLPEYMVPSLIVELDRMPLTVNGKVDRRSLPDPGIDGGRNCEYIVPRNEMESLLAGIWGEVLGLERVGVLDNFFQIGGDSIRTIQVVSRVKRLGYSIQPRDIFLHQSIEALSGVILQRTGAPAGIPGEQGQLSGECGQLPIQQMFFEWNQPYLSHYNQSILLSIDKQVSASVLETAVQLLVTQHDSLRFRYAKDAEGWQQTYGDCPGKLEVMDLKMNGKEQLASSIREIANHFQSALSIEQGQLIKVAFLQTPREEPYNRLLIIIHHLAIDGISWRIVLQDMESSITKLMQPAPLLPAAVSMGEKTASYRQWYASLEAYGKTLRLRSQINFWREMVMSRRHLPSNDIYNGPVMRRDMAYHSLKLSAESTHNLLYVAPQAYHLDMNDVLLAALAMAFMQVKGQDEVVVGLEGHGRDEIGVDADVDRTVGWFTTLYPVRLRIGDNRMPADVLKGIKEQLRAVPDNGIGYGILKYINKEKEVQASVTWDVVFNYLGRLDNVISRSRWFKMSFEGAGDNIHEENKMDYRLALNSAVQENELIINWHYSTRHFEYATIERLSAIYLLNLEQLIAHCLEQNSRGSIFTPSDHGLGRDITYEELDRFLKDEGSEMSDIMEF